MVIGRKNHCGSRSLRAYEVAGLLYALVETAKICDAEPRTYFLKASYAALEEPGAVTLPNL